jgi:hypothetical protein
MEEPMMKGNLVWLASLGAIGLGLDYLDHVPVFFGGFFWGCHEHRRPVGGNPFY